MATFFIEQFGCRATQADAAAIERQLLDRGYAPSVGAGSADVVVVNTCTVTAAADTQARQAIAAIHRENPAARIVVTGCYAQRAPEELAGLGGVAWVVGNSHKPEIPRLVAALTPVSESHAKASFVPLAALGGEILPGQHPPARILAGNILEQQELLFAPVEGGEAGHTRPVLKIQDGCDRRCAYCVIPFVRGRSRSLPPDRVVEEAGKLAARGAREVVLSGIDLGSYGRDLAPLEAETRGKGRAALRDLLRRILDETPVERLRLSSIEPMDVTEDLLALFASTPRLAPHFHMPLQSGSDRVLANMRRWYRAEHYARHTELVRESLRHAAIGADVIAGFPGETEDDHRATCELIERLPLTYLHVFSFSPRPGTRAADMPEPVPETIIARRAVELRALGERRKAAFRSAQMGRTLRMLTLNRSGEDAQGPWTRALSGNYLDVRVAGRWPANQFLEVQITGMEGVHPTGIAVPNSRFRAGSMWPLEFENHLRECSLSRMGDRDGNVPHAQPVRDGA